MGSFTFESELFKIQILGKTAWVEVREGQSWVLKNQYALPLSSQALEESPVLHAAVEYFERTRPDQSVHSLLTLQKPVQRIEKPVVRPAPTPVRVAPRKVFRGPVRPPLIPSPAS